MSAAKPPSVLVVVSPFFPSSLPPIPAGAPVLDFLLRGADCVTLYGVMILSSFSGFLLITTITPYCYSCYGIGLLSSLPRTTTTTTT